MSEVRYSVNGKYFKDFGMYISDSDGLFDGLKRKKINTYDWAEYNGSAPDLSNPKFEAREITLKGFVVGDNWIQMKSNFDSILTEFQKSGTQRLLIEPLGLKALPFEVYLEDSTPLNKTFKDRKMVGTFTLKLSEPNPIKKVLYFTGSTLNLSYTSPKETEIFYGNGTKDIVKSNASISGKEIALKPVSTYVYEGRNLLKNSDFNSDLSFWEPNGTGEIITWNAANSGSLLLDNNASDGGIYQHYYSEPNKFCVSFLVRPVFQSGGSPYLVRIWVGGAHTDVQIHTSQEWINYSVIIDSVAENDIFLIQPLGSQRLLFDKIKLERGSAPTPYSPSPSEQHYIIIAGNINEISNLTTNAAVLWEQL